MSGYRGAGKTRARGRARPCPYCRRRDGHTHGVKQTVKQGESERVEHFGGELHEQARERLSGFLMGLRGDS